MLFTELHTPVVDAQTALELFTADASSMSGERISEKIQEIENKLSVAIENYQAAVFKLLYEWSQYHMRTMYFDDDGRLVFEGDFNNFQSNRKVKYFPTLIKEVHGRVVGSGKFTVSGGLEKVQDDFILENWEGNLVARDLINVGGMVYFKKSPEFYTRVSFDFPKLVFAKALRFESPIDELKAPELRQTERLTVVRIIVGPLSLPKLERLGDLHIEGHSSVDLPLLSFVEGADCTFNVVSVSAPNLEKIKSKNSIRFANITTVEKFQKSFPQLREIGFDKSTTIYVESNAVAEYLKNPDSGITCFGWITTRKVP